jgi:hypothetical protein
LRCHKHLKWVTFRLSQSIIQVIPVNKRLWAVLKVYGSVPVQVFYLIEKPSGDRYMTGLLTYHGKLVDAESLPDFLGYASTKAECDMLYFCSLSEDDFKKMLDEIREQHTPLRW